MMAPASPPGASPPLHLTIRFSTSLPDLDVDIPAPQLTSVLSLKLLLRSRLDTRSRLRLIHQGRILPDAAALAAVLRAPLAPHADADASAKGKGKAVDGRPPVRVYVNCSIGDELSPQELADEQAEALKPPDAAASAAAAAADSSGQQAPWARQRRPRGFDRLLQAGFTQSEISTLRTQFASIHTERFAPDAMPSPDTLRSLEDAWIDSNAGELPSAANPLDDDLASMSTLLDILIRGMMIGFFFPLGSITWLLRQGVWSDKWQIFVGSGVVLSLMVGIVMTISADR